MTNRHFFIIGILACLGELLAMRAQELKSNAGHFYPFEKETAIANWQILSQTGKEFRIASTLSGVTGHKVIAIPAEPIFGYHRIIPKTLSVNGTVIDLNTQATANYSWSMASRYGVPHYFQGTEVKLELTFLSEEANPLPFVQVSLLDDFSPVAPPQKLSQYTPAHFTPIALPRPEKTDITGWKAGIVSEGKPGRFASVKGDGLLDFGMPYLGVVDKMYLCGHPDYQKPFRWTYSLLPPNMPLHGDFQVATIPSTQDKVQVNRLSVLWEAQNGKDTFSCRYSIASPGIVVHDSRNEIRISDLEYAGNYQYVLIPRKDGAEICTLESMQELQMSTNYLLFFGATEYPDVPLMVVLTRQPKGMAVIRNPRTNRLQELRFAGVDTAITATPFGIESFQPLSPKNDLFLQEAMKRCQFWSRALLAMPVAVKEFYRMESSRGEISINQQFEYAYFTDAWGTKPLEIAPLPPVLSHCGIGKHSGKVLGYPTKYGEFIAVEGKEATYTIPLAGSRRSFPMRDAEDSSVESLLADGLKEYLDFTENFDDTVQAYPYSGALLEPFAMASTMIHHMPDAEKQRLTEKLAQRLRQVNEVKRTYRYPAVDWTEMMRLMPNDEQVLTIYRDPSLPNIKLWNYYERTERFTQQKYFICYLNLCLFNVEKVLKTGTPDEIANVKFPLIENDWGAGLTFYYLYLATLATGSTDEIKANWENLKKMNCFFELFHDWACMASGYAENSLCWVEGANYGAFAVFPLLAHAVGDREAEEFAQYLAAKQLVLRASQVRAGIDYFNYYMHTPPWYFWKYYRSECNPANVFQSLPKMWPNHTVDDSLYNGTTEGLYPEYFLDMQKVLPKDFRQAIRGYKEALQTYHVKKSWTMIQQLSSVILYEALQEDIPEEVVLADLQDAEKRGMLFHEWRGIHIFSRRLPKNYFECQVRALLRLRHQPVAMQNWYNCRVVDAVWNGSTKPIGKNPGKSARIELEKVGTSSGELTLQFKKEPREIRINGKQAPLVKAKGTLVLPIPQSMILEILF